MATITSWRRLEVLMSVLPLCTTLQIAPEGRQYCAQEVKALCKYNLSHQMLSSQRLVSILTLDKDRAMPVPNWFERDGWLYCWRTIWSELLPLRCLPDPFSLPPPAPRPPLGTFRTAHTNLWSALVLMWQSINGFVNQNEATQWIDLSHRIHVVTYLLTILCKDVFKRIVSK
jgi:hypothetical protein